MLTQGQKAHFEAFGFLLIPQLLTPGEVATMKRESNEIFDEVRGEAPFDGQKREPVQPFFERRPFLASLLDDDRIHGIPESLLGPGFFLFGTEGNLHVGDTQWHGANLTDSPPDKLRSVKVAFYVDPLTKENGSLRIIPGSHRRPFADRLQVLWDQYDDQSIQPLGVSGAEMPAVALESQPGDVAVFTESVFHGAFGGAPGRHQHAVSFGEHPKTEAQRDYLKKLHEGWKYALHPSESFINSERPRVRRMVSLLVELGFESMKV
jgi:hypothetical protein